MAEYATALVIEDEPQIVRAVARALGDAFDRVLSAVTAEDGIDQAASARPDLIVLDLGLPDRDGLAVCREIRGWSSVPIIVLSARHSDRDKVALLDAGADDYVTKPFSTAELQARVRVQLRRARAGLLGEGEPIDAGCRHCHAHAIGSAGLDHYPNTLCFDDYGSAPRFRDLFH